MKIKFAMSPRNRVNICLSNEGDDSDATSSTMLTNEIEPKLFWTRWILAAIIFVLGCQAGFSMVALLMWQPFAAVYFNINPISLNMIVLGFAFGCVFTALPLAVIAQQHPNSVKALLQYGVSFFGIGFLIEAIIVVVPRKVNIMALGQLFCGMGVCVCFAVAPLIATVWFAENEQGTFLGIVWLSIAFGQAIGSSLPSMMNLNSQNSTSNNELNGVLVAFTTFATIDIIIVSLITCFLLTRPPKPPSMPEIHRVLLSGTVVSTSYWKIIRSFCQKLRGFFTDRVSITIMFILSTFVATYIAHFNMMPVSQVISNQSTQGNVTSQMKQIESLKTRSYALLAMSIGAIPGSIIAGICIDKIKKYQPLTVIFSLSTLVSSVLIFLGVYFDVFILQCIACGLFGFFCFASNCFYNEILKQFLFQSISETTLGACLSLVISILIIVYSSILKRILDSWGSIWYTVVICLVITLAFISSLTINPELKRFKYDSEQTNSSVQEL